MEYVDYILVPYLLEQKRAANLAPDAHAIFIMDVWWGWRSPNFREHVKASYPWLHLIYVPASCTPVAQPCDLGIIAYLKATVRRLYSAHACQEVLSQLNSGTPTSDVALDLGKKTLAPLLLQWWAEATSQLTSEDIVQGFEKSLLLKAFEVDTQQQALMQVTDLFRNSDKFGPFFDTTDGEEPDPGSDPINDDVSYKVSGDSLTLQPVYDDNTESDWQECLSCLNVAGVASNVDASCLEVEAALGVNTDNLDLLGTLAEPMAVLEQREKCETTVHTCGKYQPLLLLLAIMLSTQQQKKRDIDRSLRGAERRKKFVKSQTKDALAGVYKLSSVFHRVSSAPEPDIPDGPQLRSRKRGVVSLKNLAGRPVKKSKKWQLPDNAQ
ncbi:hypothetical protein CYMTET_52560 [Cymbomonas tetramitiformis]|uniref:DDE-1 domain-containing protein n=1 Tax=Cymbomonas tetramitiformis TaxID=36881 RepID=A0AAE0BJW8_9CHLO|nr:hypothetical protein CYMTET_52560 [Cymbomonas tetramitiformis]